MVSFGAQLPTTASLGGGTASLGTGNWFAPAFGAPTDVLTYADPFGKYRINWGPHVGDIVPGYMPPDPDPFPMPPPRVQALFQMVIYGGFKSDFDGSDAQVDFFGNMDGRKVAYHYSPVSSGPCSGRVDPLVNGGFDLNCEGAFGIGPGDRGAVPEPAAWALMLLGFGAIGAGLRRARPRTLTIV